MGVPSMTPMSQMSHRHGTFDKGAVRDKIWCDLEAGLHSKSFSHSHIFELKWNAEMVQVYSLQADLRPQPDQPP